MPNEKHRIVRRLQRKLIEIEPHNTGYLLKAITYTGLHPTTLKAIEEKTELYVSTDELERSFIYNKLCNFYITRYKLPTTYELFDALNRLEANESHMDIDRFRKLLLKMDFIWKKQSDKRVVVIEKPLVKFERCNYLKQMKHCRMNSYNDIYYVDENAYNGAMFMDMKTSREFEKLTNGGWQQKIIYAVGRTNVICLKEINDFSAAALEDWVLTDLCPFLMNPSVIVVQDLDHHNAKLFETPTLHSTKAEMMAWLDYHQVQYDETMSRFELYKLAEECTDLDRPLYKIDGILKSRGHTLLRIPKSISEVTPTLLLFYLLEKNWSLCEFSALIKTANEDDYKKTARACLHSLLASSSQYLESYFVGVATKEHAMLSLEKTVDMVLDKLLRVESSGVSEYLEKDDSDVVSCSDSE